MLFVENPLKLLYVALGIMLFILALIKISNFFESLIAKSKSNTKKDKPKDETVNTEKKLEDKKELKPEKSEECVIEDILVDSKNMTNYLYDRFVIDPTLDDLIKDDIVISNTFLNDDDYSEIRDKKVKIKVEPVQTQTYSRENVYRRIQEITNNNRSEKEKMLDEFNNLPKEMKLLLIENILQSIE